ncbi:MAG: hypothetical protein LCH52_08490 [Bacteroidetes bacterium]|nr:hypothetical protein [Bacteroidota bacterium]
MQLERTIDHSEYDDQLPDDSFFDDIKDLDQSIGMIPVGETGLTSDENLRLNTLKHQITSTTENFLTDIGAYFKEAQEILANHHKGFFRKFIEDCGYGHDNVYKLINRYNLVVRNADNSNYLESLPTRVLTAAGSKKAPAQLTQAVLAGEVSTLKELDDWKRKYREQTLRVIELNNELTAKNEEIQELQESGSTTVKEVVIEMQDPKTLAELKMANDLLDDKENAIRTLSEKVKKSESQIDKLNTELSRLEPLKNKAEEIERIKKELDKRQAELRVINLDMDVYKALRVARETLHRDILVLATITRIPETISENMKSEIRNIHESMKNFMFATTEKFKLNK